MGYGECYLETSSYVSPSCFQLRTTHGALHEILKICN